MQFASPEAAMRYALALAARGIGRVEPNPPVGAVIVDDHLRLISDGFHQSYGGPHAEVHTLRQAGDRAEGAILFVTLEPCAHHGKTPPCAPAIIHAGIKRVFVAHHDPFPKVDGRGIEQLRKAGVEVHVGLLEAEANRLLAPFLKRTATGLPYVHAKWAMTVDGKIATATGDSKWISGESSRAIVHELRGRMDGIAVGVETAIADDPSLTARPSGPRTATRIVFDRQARLPLGSRLVRTAETTPVVVVTSQTAPPERVEALRLEGVKILSLPEFPNPDEFLKSALEEFGLMGMTNLLIEGGGRLLGSFFDADLIDELHVFIGPMIVGNATARSPVAGSGTKVLAEATRLNLNHATRVGQDTYLHYTRNGSSATPSMTNDH
jgi:diaminohydroxyphosphoribosylaminopyrimidine deaminase/5-amino-6-(5-phosphoribosylamino)uracil reductase